MPWNKVTLIGVGLLGGSLGLALQRKHLAKHVTGYVRRAASIEECARARATTHATGDLAEAVTDADLVVFCTPVTQMAQLLRTAAPHLKAGAIITDVGSVKRSIVRELEPIAKKAGARFVGSHPMAGSEKTGVLASREDLFVNAVCVVTPTARSERNAVREVEQLWEAVGARVLRMSPTKHDLLVSRSSHLPHVVAANLVKLVLDPAHPPEQRILCANGFRDSTRIASGSPEMWRDIVQTNSDYLARALRQLSKQLNTFADWAERGDYRRVKQLFEEAKERRDTWSKTASSPSPE